MKHRRTFFSITSAVIGCSRRIWEARMMYHCGEALINEHCGRLKIVLVLAVFFRSFVTYEIDKEKNCYHINWTRKVIKSLIGNFYCEFKKLAIIIIFIIDVHCCTKTSLKSSSYHDKDKKEPVLKRVGQ